MRRLAVLVVAMALVALAAPAAARNASFPDVVALPNGFFPEGIAVGEGHTAYVGSLVDGAIWKADLRTGEGALLVPGVPGRMAVGMDYDAQTGRLYVAGGPDGKGYVYDTSTGALVAELPLVTGGAFVNDVIVTKDAAYFTDSFAPRIAAVPLTRSGDISGPAEVVPLGGDFEFVPGEFNANGIVATPDGKTLVVVNLFTGDLYTVDPGSGVASLVDLGGVAVNGDGLVLSGKTLYAVVGGANQIVEIALAPDLASGTIVGAITSPEFDVPTTAARFGSSLYAVNAKFGTPPTPSTPYEIVRVDRSVE